MAYRRLRNLWNINSYKKYGIFSRSDNNTVSDSGNFFNFYNAVFAGLCCCSGWLIFTVEILAGKI